VDAHRTRRPLLIPRGWLRPGVALLALALAACDATPPPPKTAESPAPTATASPADSASAPAPGTTGVTRAPDAAVPPVAARTPRAAKPAPKPPAKPTGPETKIAILLGSSGRGDQSFSDAALAGIEAAKKHGRLRVAEYQPARGDDYDAIIDRHVTEGAELVIGVGFLYAEPFRAASTRHPGARFLLLDVALPDAPTVKSVTFRGDEGSFLAGAVAVGETTRGVVGFVGGMSLPVIQQFECGWKTGVWWATREQFKLVKGSIVYLGDTPAAFTDPAEGELRANELINDKNVDVLYAAAGASGLGVIEAARRAKIKAIGVDTDQSHLARDVVVTSMRKRLDRAVETAIAEVRRGRFQGGVVEMTLANGGVDLVLPGKLQPATQKLIEKARAGIIAGRIPVCVKDEERVPAWNFPPRPQSP